MEQIPHNRPLVTDEDRQAVDGTLKSGWIASGPAVTCLESWFVDQMGKGGACAVSSGTAALYLALKVLQVRPGEKVVVPTFSCAALLRAVFAVGAVPVVCDVHSHDATIDPASAAERMSFASPAAVIAVHAHGARAEIEQLSSLGGRIIEDCAHALGGEYDGRLLGAVGDASVFSFFATKIVTSGQGGLAYFASDADASRALTLRDKALDWHDPILNIHMADVQAAMANSQLRRLDSIVDRRKRIFQRYLDALPLGLSVMTSAHDQGQVDHRFILVSADSSHRDALFKHFEARGIACAYPFSRGGLLHSLMELNPRDFPGGERLSETRISIPLYPALLEEEIERICEAIANAPTS